MREGVKGRREGKSQLHKSVFKGVIAVCVILDLFENLLENR